MGSILNNVKKKAETARLCKSSDFYLAQNRAIAAVYQAKREGLLLPLSECVCVDCGKPAQVYDHRDYSKPLDVQPVCQHCNMRRGKAAWSAPADLKQGGVPGPRHFESHFDALRSTQAVLPQSSLSPKNTVRSVT